MRRIATIGAAAIACGACLGEAAGAAPQVENFNQRWNLTVASEARYYAWKGDRGTPGTGSTAPGSGSELYVPFAIQLAGQPTDDWKVTLLGRGGWVQAQQSTAGLAGKVATFTDTQTLGTLTYLGLPGFQPFISLSLNLPTGKPVLPGEQANARMDPDLVGIGSFGEGFNIGPSAGFSVPITNMLIVTASFGYTWRGAFDRERSTSETDPTMQTPTTVDPGDVWTATAGIGYQNGPWTLNLTGTISEETTTTENGVDLYRAGRRYLGTGTATYAWPESWGWTTLTASFAHSNRNAVKFTGASELMKEFFNTNSNLYRIGLQHLFALGSLAIGPTGSFLYRDNNGYNSSTLQFVPAKKRWAAGAVLRYAATNKVTLNARFEHVWVRENSRPAPDGQLYSVLLGQLVAGSAVPALSSDGWMVSGGANITF